MLGWAAGLGGRLQMLVEKFDRRRHRAGVEKCLDVAGRRESGESVAGTPAAVSRSTILPRAAERHQAVRLAVKEKAGRIVRRDEIQRRSLLISQRLFRPASPSQ